jgi:hypothetical protein
LRLQQALLASLKRCLEPNLFQNEPVPTYSALPGTAAAAASNPTLL